MNEVRDNRAEQEFTLEVDGERAVAAYQLYGDEIVFTHTVVPPAIEGRGVGSRLIRVALDSARDRGLKVLPQCPFVADFIRKHPGYRDLVG
ncbi:GNAT family N-acetyltransferase [Sphingomonas sp. Leaf343]|uniref:GNAT family N-acetyltransferase n=1 Tax=Sphingomonas sp. Leaf343 TaxID=1736345 RepID=UPI0006F1F433|nr:GNAT family N-acetyltransferase [Sphingomonas sp. Leaf343]KQR82248.1 acetyltransferase [Sphingomonas sp. Leaf343]